MSHDIHIADLGELERQEAQSIALRRALYSGKAIDLENYHPYEEVHPFNYYHAPNIAPNCI